MMGPGHGIHSLNAAGLLDSVELHGYVVPSEVAVGCRSITDLAPTIAYHHAGTSSEVGQCILHVSPNFCPIPVLKKRNCSPNPPNLSPNSTKLVLW